MGSVGGLDVRITRFFLSSLGSYVIDVNYVTNDSDDPAINVPTQ